MKLNESTQVLIFVDEKQMIINFPQKKQLKYSFKKNGVNTKDFSSLFRFIRLVMKKNCDISNQILFVVNSEFIRIKEELVNSDELHTNTTFTESNSSVQKQFIYSKILKRGKKNIISDEHFTINYSNYWQKDFYNIVMSPLMLEYQCLVFMPEHLWIAQNYQIENQTCVIVRNNDCLVICYDSAQPILISKIKNRGINELVNHIANYFDLPYNIAAELYLTYGNVLINNDIKYLIVDINLPENQVREVVLSDLVYLIQQYFLSLFKSISETINSKKISVTSSSIIFFGKLISHLRLSELSSLYFKQKCYNYANEYSPNFDIFDEIEFPIYKPINESIENKATNETTNIPSNYQQNTITISNSVLGRFVRKIAMEWNTFMYETDVDVTS